MMRLPLVHLIFAVGFLSKDVKTLKSRANASVMKAIKNESNSPTALILTISRYGQLGDVKRREKRWKA
jgi:hypothetical protein